MKILAISDLHNQQYILEIDKTADVLVCTGDSTSYGTPEELASFLEWIDNLVGFKHKIFIAGNHDIGLAFKEGGIQSILDYYQKKDGPNGKIHYLENSGVSIMGFNFYGIPGTLLKNWAFYRSESEMMDDLGKVPESTDVLLTHSPPFAVLDVFNQNIHTGYESIYSEFFLTKRLSNVRFHVFGHIHEGFGMKETPDGQVFHNASISRLDGGLNKPKRFHFCDHTKLFLGVD